MFPQAQADSWYESRLKLLVEASSRLLSSLSVEDVLVSLLDLSPSIIAAEAYCIWRFSDEQWRPVIAKGLSQSYLESTVPSRGPADMAVSRLVYEDVETDSQLVTRREIYRSEGIRALLVLPLRIHGENTGTLAFYYRQPRAFAEIELELASGLAHLAGSAITTAELYAEQRNLTAAADDGRRRVSFLAEASKILASSLDYDTTLANVAKLAVGQIADWCTVDVIEQGNAPRRLVVSHVNPEKVAWATELRKRYPPDENSGPYRVMRSGKPEIVSTIENWQLVAAARDAEHLAIMRELNPVSYMCVPMIARDTVLGALTFVSAESHRSYGESDLALVQELADRCAVAVDNSMLYTQAKEALDSLRSVNAELRRLNDDLNEFGYAASHDLREPLRTIQIYSELLNRRYASRLDGQALEFLQYMRTASARMEMLVRDLMAYTQITRVEALVEPADSNEVLAGVLSDLSSAIQASGAVITADPLPPAHVHGTHLGQLFQNLISNALKYRDPERTPAVHVAADQQNGSATFSVRDNGIGIDPEYQSQIFGLFKRLHSDDQGTGIGLAICKRIVERYHGQIWVDSKPGDGATFFFTLPVDHKEPRSSLS